ERAEKTHVRYPLFHFGPTPSSVRHELAAAQTQRTPGGSAAGTDVKPASGVSDPFAKRSLPLPATQASGQMAANGSESQHAVMPAIYDQAVRAPNRNVNQVAAMEIGSDHGRDKPEAPLPPSLQSTSADRDAQPDGLGRSLHSNFSDSLP